MDTINGNISTDPHSSDTQISGQTLAWIVEHEGPLSPGDALDMILRVGEKVKSLHSQRKNHLGLQPEDIVISNISRKADIMQYHQAEEDDIFSLGCLLYFALSGKMANGHSLTFPDKISEPMQAALRRAIAPGPGEGYASVSGFLSEIHRATTKGASRKDSSSLISEARAKDDKKTSGFRYILFGAIAVLVVVAGLLIALFATPDKSDKKDNVSANTVVRPEPPATATAAENLKISTNLGEAHYTGEIDKQGRPHGEGTAEFSGGEKKSYSGGWVHGIMEGEATYVFKNGDTFKGRFVNGMYHEGRYTFASDGLYFEGTYRDEQPWDGKWYDREGRQKYSYKEGTLQRQL